MPDGHAAFFTERSGGEPWWTRLSGQRRAGPALFARFDQHQRPLIDHRCRALDARGARRLDVLRGPVVGSAPFARVRFDQCKTGSVEHAAALGQYLFDRLAHDNRLDRFGRHRGIDGGRRGCSRCGSSDAGCHGGQRGLRRMRLWGMHLWGMHLRCRLRICLRYGCWCVLWCRCGGMVFRAGGGSHYCRSSCGRGDGRACHDGCAVARCGLCIV